MGQKINPYGFRLGITTDYKSRWFADSSKDGQRYRDYVKEDVAIRKLMSEGMDRAGIARVDIERTRDRVRVDIHTARPGIVIGRKGAEIDKLKEELSKMTGKEIYVDIVEIKSPEIDAQLEALVARRGTGEARFEELDMQLASTQERHAELDHAIADRTHWRAVRGAVVDAAVSAQRLQDRVEAHRKTAGHAREFHW